MKESVAYQKAVEEGRARGRLQQARRSLFLVGTKCLGEPSRAVAATVEAIENLGKLRRLIVAALDVASWEDLLGLAPKRTRRKSSS
jgi:hypothetical protein